MKLHSLLLLLLCSLKSFAAAPDSVYLFTYAIPQDPHKGIHIAYSADGKSWTAIGQDQSFVSSDFGSWGSQKRMFHPSVIKDGDRWYAVWQVNDNTNQFATAWSDKLSVWKPQDYPYVETPNVIAPVLSKRGGQFIVTYKTADNKVYQVESRDFKKWTKAHEVQAYRSNEVKAKVEGMEYDGCITRAPWTLVENLINRGDATTLRNRQHGERMADDANRFRDLKTVEATLSLRPTDAKAISPNLVGIFFEDISYAADGGLYAELLQNRDFEYNRLDRGEWNAQSFWHLDGNGTQWDIATDRPIHKNNEHYAVLTTTSVGASLVNDGHDGIVVRKGEKYNLTIFIKKLEGAGKVKVSIIDGSNVLAETTVSGAADWKQCKAVLTAKADCDKAKLAVEPLQKGKVAVDFVSLFPQKTFKNRTNGLRPDLAQLLADMHPKFVRFPGGCVSHGQGLDNMYRWIYTVGPLWERKQISNIWNYHQSMGLGFFEYFQFCEDIGAEPLPVLPAGVPCQNSARNGHGQQGGLPFKGEDFKVKVTEDLPTMEEYLQELLNLIEWANGDPKTSKWAKMRADAGHPKPFNLKYLGVGNEDLISDVFAERFTFLNRGIKAKYPDIQVVGTVGPFFEGSDYEFGWKLARQENVDIVDEHYYVDPGWYIHNQNFYDRYDRNGTKVYLGEWASRNNKWENALVEALHLTNLERNADVVVMSSYAPLFCKDGHSNWNPDLIYFNNTGARPTPGYYVQKAFGVNNGVEYIPSDLSLRGNQDVRLRINASIVKADNGDLIVKLVNLLPASVSIRADLGNLAGYDTQNAQWSTMTGNPGDGAVTPTESTKSVESQMTITLDKYSFTVIRIKKI
ncbi:MAG: alpha-L-arabinofuranosidase [Bacteroidaceae bacterium]|nr:alpha-L-arabinofuranosidase [Bacteroidaceae bacterium]